MCGNKLLDLRFLLWYNLRQIFDFAFYAIYGGRKTMLSSYQTMKN